LKFKKLAKHLKSFFGHIFGLVVQKAAVLFNLNSQDAEDDLTEMASQNFPLEAVVFFQNFIKQFFDIDDFGLTICFFCEGSNSFNYLL
jgi:hypothetical protein